MDQINQENELQKAIDDITKNGGGQDQEQSADLAAGLEEQIQNQMGTPPVPPMPPMGDGPAETMPPMDGGEQGVGADAPVGDTPAMPEMPAMGDSVNGGEAPVEEAAAVEVTVGQDASGNDAQAGAGIQNPEVAAPLTSSAPEVQTEAVEVSATGPDINMGGELNDMGGNDITSVKEAMLRDLFPIMDKVDMGAEERFELYRTMLDSSNDKSLIRGAYEVVKGITDEGARAEALLFLIKKADA